MAWNPYFRYRTTSLNLGNVRGPNFPLEDGLVLHSIPSTKRDFSIKTRDYPTVDTRLRVTDLSQTDRNLYWTFWETTLDYGYNDFTFIDNRSRYLFDTSWNNWTENYKAKRGGTFNLRAIIESPFIWTPPVWGFYPSTTNSLVNHNLSGDDLSVVDGAMTTYNASAINGMRKNGWAFTMTGDGATSIQTGATGTVSWKSGNKESSCSIFCQAWVDSLASDFYLVELSDGTNRFAIKMKNGGGGDNELLGEIKSGSTTAEVTKVSGSGPVLSEETWYDLCIAWDGINERVALYYKATDIGNSFTRFRDGQTDQEDSIITTLSSSVSVPRVNWTTVNLFRESEALSLQSLPAYMQNIMFIDDFVTANQFNAIGRLCYMWNNKNSGTWPA